MMPTPVRHVLMTADTVGGVWIYALELAREFEERGIHVSLATMGAPLRSDQWAGVRQLSNVDVYESTYKLEWMKRPWSDVEASGAWLQRLEKELRPDLVHLNGYAHGAVKWRAPAVVVAHSCVLSWWQALNTEQAPDQWTEYRKRIKAGLHSASAVIAVSQAMLAEVNHIYGMPTRAFVIPNGRCSSDFTTGPKQDLILASGRFWDAAKNINALRNIASELSWPVFVAGEGPPQQSPLRCLGLLPPTDLRSWFSRAGIYVAPAFYEPFGLAILEAALSECALVLGDIPSLRENWDEAALFVPPADEGALKRAIESLTRNPYLRRKMGMLARERAQVFTRSRMASSYLKTYAQLSGVADKGKIRCA